MRAPIACGSRFSLKKLVDWSDGRDLRLRRYAVGPKFTLFRGKTLSVILIGVLSCDGALHSQLNGADMEARYAVELEWLGSDHSLRMN